MKIVIDAERCQGHGRCWDNAYELIGDDEMGRGYVRNPDADVPPELLDAAHRAVTACPEQAVSLVE